MIDYKVQPIPKKETYPWLLGKHYAKRIPSISYSFGLYNDNCLVGVCTYGFPLGENTMLCCGEKYRNDTIELNRLIKNDNLKKNTQSWFVSQTFKLLPKPKIIISYVDPNNGHTGYTYQSLNFIFTGKGGSPKEYVFNNKQYTNRHMKDYWFKNNNLPFDETKTIDENFINAGGNIIKMIQKNRYVIFIGSKKDKKEYRENFIWSVLPYLKDNNKRYDTSYEPNTQGVLF